MKLRIPALILALLPSSLAAQSPQIAAAMAAGQVGERYDGYLGFAEPPSEALRRQVTAVNIQRRNLYIQLATQRGVNPQLVGLTTACALFLHIPVGGAYMLNDNAWHRRAVGQPEPAPDYCR